MYVSSGVLIIASYIHVCIESVRTFAIYTHVCICRSVYSNPVELPVALAYSPIDEYTVIKRCLKLLSV